MITDIEPPTRLDFIAHNNLSKAYGVKAAGLSFLPPAWRLDFAALSITVQKRWSEGDDLKSNAEIKALNDWLLGKAFKQIILRSSGTEETLQDRGKFESIVLEL